MTKKLELLAAVSNVIRLLQRLWQGSKSLSITTKNYSMRIPICEIETKLSDGRPVCLRTIRPSDEAKIRDGIREMSDRSRYLRFFSAFREPPESVVKRLVAVDGHDHIAWGAILLDGKHYPPVGAAHAIRSETHASTGELAIAVLDDYQGQGLARMLIAAVLVECNQEELQNLDIHVLSENQVATNLIVSIGAQRMKGVGSVRNYQLNVEEALDKLSHTAQPLGVADVLIALKGLSR